jgi:hypothetical protein
MIKKTAKKESKAKAILWMIPAKNAGQGYSDLTIIANLTHYVA